MIIQVQPVIDYSVRRLCKKSYPRHPKGCPNYMKRPTCPPLAALFDKTFDCTKPVYAIINEFDLGNHIKRMKIEHPNWSEAQLNCVLYWQGTARKQLREEIKRFRYEFSGKRFCITGCPEAMGVNVTETLKQAGIILEWPPVNIAKQVALAGMLLPGVTSVDGIRTEGERCQKTID